jgi:hypothetical protein
LVLCEDEEIVWFVVEGTTWTHRGLLRGVNPKKSCSFGRVEPFMTISEVKIGPNRGDINRDVSRGMSSIDERQCRIRVSQCGELDNWFDHCRLWREKERERDKERDERSGEESCENHRANVRKDTELDLSM